MKSLKLSEEALAGFEHDYFRGTLWLKLVEELEKFSKNRKITVLDIGGGAGFFADKLLDKMPTCHLTLIDNAAFLLKKNKKHPRKIVLEADAEELSLSAVGGKKFDVIFLNLMLHHMVQRSKKKSRALQEAVIRGTKGLLKKNGRLIICENVCTPILPRPSPGGLTYYVTRSRISAPITRRMGANTAGVGVLYFDKGELEELALRCGYALLLKEGDLPYSPRMTTLLNLKNIQETFFIFKKA